MISQTLLKTTDSDPALLPKMQRRAFLRNGGILAAALACNSFPALNLTSANLAPANNLKLGLQLYSLRKFSLDAALQHAKDLGFEQVEFYGGMFPIDSSDEKIAEAVFPFPSPLLSISAHGVNAFGKDFAANLRIFSFAKPSFLQTIPAGPAP